MRSSWAYGGGPGLAAGSDGLDMLTDDLPRTEPDKSFQSEEKHEEVVQLTQGRQEVWKKIYGDNDIGQYQNEEELGSYPDTTVH